MDKLIEHKQTNLIVDMAEYYYTNWVKDTKEFDPFFFKICKLAFKHGADEHRFSFMKRMIKITGGKNEEFNDLLSTAYTEKGDYLRAYVFSFNTGSPHKTADLLLNHIIPSGYPPEAELFKLRAVFEYLVSK